MAPQALPRGGGPSGRGAAKDEAELEEVLQAEAEADEAWQAAKDEQAELDALLADDGLGFLSADEAEFAEYTDEELQLEAPPPGPEARDAALLQTATHFNGTVSTFANKSVRGPRVELSRAKREAHERGKAAKSAIAHAEEMWRLEAEETERLKQLHLELQAAEDELARLQKVGEREPNVTQQRAQAQAIQAVGAALAAQQELQRTAEGAARQAQLEADGSALSRDSALRRLTELLPVGEEQATCRTLTLALTLTLTVTVTVTLTLTLTVTVTLTLTGPAQPHRRAGARGAGARGRREGGGGGAPGARAGRRRAAGARGGGGAAAHGGAGGAPEGGGAAAPAHVAAARRERRDLGGAAREAGEARGGHPRAQDEHRGRAGQAAGRQPAAGGEAARTRARARE